MSVDARFQPLTARMVVEAVGFNVGLFDVGLRGILAIIRSGATAREAIALVERPPASDA